MQTQTPTKPVMDIAAPPKAPAAVPASPPSSPTTSQPAPAPMKPASPAPIQAPAPAAKPVFSTRTGEVQVADAPAAPPTPVEAAAATPGIPLKPAAKQYANRAGQQTPHRAPVALITMTVFVMLVLAGLALVIYITSQSA